jgi:hypothetical protein
MKRQITLTLFFALLLSGASWAFEFMEPWGYVWLNGANYQTNLEREDFNSNLGRAESKIGVNLIPLWAEAKVQPYIAYYGVGSSDRHSWNNNSVSGGGVQVMPLLGVGWADWMQDLKVFYESLSIQYSSHDDDEMNEWGDYGTKYNSDKDNRVGAEIWHVWNQPGQYTVENRGLLWGELWAHASYRQTDFSAKDKNGLDYDTYLAFFQPKVGFYLWKAFNTISIEPYFKADAMMSGRDYPYLNNLALGVGLRVRPFMGGYLFGIDFRALKQFKFFAETESVSYFRDQGDIDHDFRFGFDFNFGR